ncbi:hypothetical protein ACLUEY_09900 [Vreelandella aquamarina]
MNASTQKKHQHLCHRAFLLAAWGDTDAERRSEIEQIRHLLAASGYQAAFENALRDGQKAHRLANTLHEKLNTQGDEVALGRWLESLRPPQCPPDVFGHVVSEYNKWKKARSKVTQASSRHTGQGAKVFHSTLDPVSLREDGEHPNSLRALRPCSHWEILIDETGTHFDSTTQQAKASDPELGRVVAVIKAHNAPLPNLKRSFHGIDETPETIDQVLSDLLNTPQVGIFGFTLRDSLAFGSYWMNHITQLVRWVLYMLPLQADTPTRVQVSIEQRLNYQPDDDRLQALAQTLEGEFKALDAERYRQLSLQLNIVAKTHPHLAYADAVAYTWGSPAAVSNDRLKKSRLSGHCLLHPHADHALAHLYQALSYHESLPGDQWFPLCAAAEQDAPNGLLYRWLERLGRNVQQDRDAWARLLEEVQHRQRHKGVATGDLQAALDWLERFKPDDDRLSGELILAFLSARLATANHSGEADITALQKLLHVGLPLEDENAPAVCHALLRSAITATNRFEFSALEGVLQDWANKPMAIPGRLNHVKLHSTLGQLAAFQHQAETAEKHFNQALDALTPLSDRRQAHKEALQIHLYRLMARLDGHTQDIHALLKELEHRLTDATGRQNLIGVARRFAVGGSGPEVYLHHLFLRACIAYPNLLRLEIDAYLEQSHAWQSHDSHPWGLIEAYRGWLLARRKGNEVTATQHFKAAVTLCYQPSHGITLRWMGAVLHHLALSLLPNFKAARPKNAQPEVLKADLPQAPHHALEQLTALSTQASHKERHTLVAQCLPFNFH